LQREHVAGENAWSIRSRNAESTTMGTEAARRPGDERFGALLRRYRVAAAFSQEALAARAGMSTRAVSDLERGIRTRPYLETVRRLSEALGLDPAAQAELAGAARALRPSPSSVPATTVNAELGAATLPIPLTPLVGREREILELVDLLRGGARLVTLTGPGGIGKTRVAIAVAQAVSDHFVSGIAFVSLATITDPDLVLVTIAHALGVPDAPGQVLLARVRAFLQSRHPLLVLDNCEHLLDAAAQVVGDLVTHCGHVTVLCTSRSRLSIPGEQVIPLDVLDAGAACTLFVDRVCALDPTLGSSHNLKPYVDAICSRLDRLPLAIELAAARISVLPPHSLLERLEQRLPLLVGHHRNAPARQRTMRSTIGWSYDLLSTEEQRLFRRLGVFAGGFAFDAAVDVAGNENEVLANMETLVISSLVRSEEAVGGVPRFTMLETIREFAVERLAASGEEPDIRQRHARYFAITIENELSNQDGPQLRSAHDRIEADLQNCRMAMAWALENGDAETGIRLSGALWRTWCFARNYGDMPWRERLLEGRAWLDRTLAERDGLPVSVLAEALAGAAHLAIFDRDMGAARAWAEELQARTVDEPNAYGSYWAGRLLARFARARQAWEVAEAMLAQASAAALVIRNAESGRSQVLLDIAELDDFQGNAREALDHYRQALILGRGSGNPYVIATAGIAYARLLRKQADLYHPTSILCEVLTHALGLRFFGLANNAMSELACLALKGGQAERAATFLAVADNLCPNSIAALSPYYGVYEEALAETRTRLSNDAFAAAWDAGSRLGGQEAIAEAQAIADGAKTITEAGTPPP